MSDLPHKFLPDQQARRNFEAIDGRFPVATQNIAANAVTAINVAAGSTSAPTTNSTADPMTATIPEMTITADFAGDPIVVLFSGQFSHDTSAALTEIALYEGSNELANTRRGATAHAINAVFTLGTMYSYTPTTGSKTITVKWHVGSGVATASSTNRHLTIIRLKR